MLRSQCLVAMLVTVAAGFPAACNKQPTKGMGGKGLAGMPPVPVMVAKADQESVPTQLRAIGTVDASAIVQVKSQIAGEIVKVAFTEGQNVAQGDLLFVIDPRPYEDALQQAEANVARDRAQIVQYQAMLARDEAQAKYAATDAALQASLHKEGLTSTEQADQAHTTAATARESARATHASLDTARATLESDLAAVQRARLDVSYCEIHAPISGRTGNLLVHAGNLVKVNDVPLVVIHKVVPIFVNFSVPEQHLAAIRRLSTGRKLPVTVSSQDDPGRSETGSLAVIDNAVDTTTGTIHLKAVFDNRSGMLWPGQFVTAVLTLDNIPNATVVPAEAVQSGQRGSFIYVVKPDSTVEARIVTPGVAFGKKMVIEKGLAPGETIVIDGQLRLFPGARIETVAPGKFGLGQS